MVGQANAPLSKVSEVKWRGITIEQVLKALKVDQVPTYNQYNSKARFQKRLVEFSEMIELRLGAETLRFNSVFFLPDDTIRLGVIDDKRQFNPLTMKEFGFEDYGLDGLRWVSTHGAGDRWQAVFPSIEKNRYGKALEQLEVTFNLPNSHYPQGQLHEVRLTKEGKAHFFITGKEGIGAQPVLKSVTLKFIRSGEEHAPAAGASAAMCVGALRQ